MSSTISQMYLLQELEIKYTQETFWMDSKVVLGHISNEARRFHIFLVNRIQKIKESKSSDQLRYAMSNDDTADYALSGESILG